MVLSVGTPDAALVSLIPSRDGVFVFISHDVYPRQESAKRRDEDMDAYFAAAVAREAPGGGEDGIAAVEGGGGAASLLQSSAASFRLPPRMENVRPWVALLSHHVLF